MEARNGIRRAGHADPRRVRLHPGGDGVSDFDAELHRIEELLRLNELRLAVLLSQLERLNADVALATQRLEAGR